MGRTTTQMNNNAGDREEKKMKIIDQEQKRQPNKWLSVAKAFEHISKVFHKSKNDKNNFNEI